jgi:hypothetical protein
MSLSYSNSTLLEVKHETTNLNNSGTRRQKIYDNARDAHDLFFGEGKSTRVAFIKYIA